MDEEKGVLPVLWERRAQSGIVLIMNCQHLGTKWVKTPLVWPLYTEVMMRSLVKCNFARPKYNHVSVVEIQSHQYCCNTTTKMLFNYNHINIVEMQSLQWCQNTITSMLLKYNNFNDVKIQSREYCSSLLVIEPRECCWKTITLILLKYNHGNIFEIL